jgi:hypothetical protein
MLVISPTISKGIDHHYVSESIEALRTTFRRITRPITCGG